MQTTPLPPLTWDTPSFRRLFEHYWEDVEDEDAPRLETPQNQYEGPYASFYRDNGYLHGPEPNPNHLIEEDVHPIFGPSHWNTRYPGITEWYKFAVTV